MNCNLYYLLMLMDLNIIILITLCHCSSISISSTTTTLALGMTTMTMSSHWLCTCIILWVYIFNILLCKQYNKILKMFCCASSTWFSMSFAFPWGFTCCAKELSVIQVAILIPVLLRFWHTKWFQISYLSHWMDQSSNGDVSTLANSMHSLPHVPQGKSTTLGTTSDF